MVARSVPAGGRVLGTSLFAREDSTHPEVERLREALRDDLNSADAWLFYAVALSDHQWRNRDAADAVGMAIALSPFTAEYHFFRGYCHQKLCLLAEAAADLEMAAKLDQNHQNALYYLGQTYFYMGEYERALIALERLTHISPPEAEWAAICNWLYLTLRRLGRDDEARRWSGRVGKDATPAVATGTLGNTWTDCQYMLACQAYNGFISPDEAIHRAERYGALNLWYVTMYMAMLCDLDGHLEKAVALYERTIDTFAGTEITKMRTIVLPRLKALTGKTYSEKSLEV